MGKPKKGCIDYIRHYLFMQKSEFCASLVQNDIPGPRSITSSNCEAHHLTITSKSPASSDNGLEQLREIGEDAAGSGFDQGFHTRLIIDRVNIYLKPLLPQICNRFWLDNLVGGIIGLGIQPIQQRFRVDNRIPDQRPRAAFPPPCTAGHRPGSPPVADRQGRRC